MFSHHHLSPSLRPCLRTLSRPVASTSSLVQHRGVSFSLPRHARQTIPKPDVLQSSPEERPELEEMSAQQDGEREKQPSTYREFMEKIGHKYQYAAEAPQWLTADTPFPMNPSFKPPPPISDFQKDVIFGKFLADPLTNNPRKLAQRYNISLKRMDAILRLKGLEKNWVKGKPLQTGFQIGMDRLLSSHTHPAIASQSTEHVVPGVVEDRSDVTQADKLEQLERRDAARYRYERMYWESTPEDGREPLLPGVLEAVKKRAQLKEAADKARANRMLATRPPTSPWVKRPARHAFVAWRKGGVATRFVDVGAEFLDVDGLVKSRAASRHKSKVRQQKAEEAK